MNIKHLKWMIHHQQIKYSFSHKITKRIIISAPLFRFMFPGNKIYTVTFRTDCITTRWKPIQKIQRVKKKKLFTVVCIWDKCFCLETENQTERCCSEAGGYSQPKATSLSGTMLASSPPADSLTAKAAYGRIYVSVVTADMQTPVLPGAGMQGPLTQMWWTCKTLWSCRNENL